MASGLYTSASEVVREGLRLLLRFEDAKTKGLDKFSGLLAEGLAQAEAGEVIEGGEALARSKAKIAARRAARDA